MSFHLKRICVSKLIPIKKKSNVWISKPSPGPHSVSNCMTPIILLRDLLKFCDTAKEAKKIINKKEISVNGVILNKYKLPIGFMDTISFTKINLYYKVTLSLNGKLTLTPITKDESNFKLCKIKGKTTIKNGKTQLNLHDGRNILTNDPSYKTEEVIKIDLSTKKIIEKYSVNPGMHATIIKGNKIGTQSKILECIKKQKLKETIIILENGSKTLIKNIFVHPITIN